MRKQPINTSLTPSAVSLVDDLIGTFFGTTRSEVVRFMILTWMTEHSDVILQVAEARKNQGKRAKA